VALVVRHDAVVGMGGTLYAVPMKKTYVHGDHLRFEISEKELQNAKTVNWDTFDKDVNEKWIKDVHVTFKVEYETEKDTKHHEGQRHGEQETDGQAEWEAELNADMD
jgi:hypothetical protein